MFAVPVVWLLLCCHRSPGNNNSDGKRQFRRHLTSAISFVKRQERSRKRVDSRILIGSRCPGGSSLMRFHTDQGKVKRRPHLPPIHDHLGRTRNWQQQKDSIPVCPHVLTLATGGCRCQHWCLHPPQHAVSFEINPVSLLRSCESVPLNRWQQHSTAKASHRRPTKTHSTATAKNVYH